MSGVPAGVDRFVMGYVQTGHFAALMREYAIAPFRIPEQTTTVVRATTPPRAMLPINPVFPEVRCAIQLAADPGAAFRAIAGPTTTTKQGSPITVHSAAIAGKDPMIIFSIAEMRINSHAFTSTISRDPTPASTPKAPAASSAQSR